MKHFYNNILGFSISEDLDEYIEFDCKGIRFAICSKSVMYKTTGHPGYQEKGNSHNFELAFPIGSPEDVNHFFNELVKKGVTIIKKPEMMPWGRQTAFIADPDGNIHEIYSVQEESELE